MKITKQPYPMQTTRHIPTPDDWYPTAKDGTVRSSVMIDKRYKCCGYWGRICFWGDDDFGLEVDKYFDKSSEAKAWFKRQSKWLNNLAIICQDDLIKMGFYNA